MALEINNQYDFFKNVKLTNDGYLQVSIVGGGGGGTGGTFAYTAVDYNDLLTKTGMSDADLGYVFNSQGTQWLPGTLGGTYYPKGIYVYSGSTWTSDRNSIAIQLEQDTLGLATKANISGATFSGSVDHTSTILSGGTDLGDLFAPIGAIGSGGATVQDGLNTYTGGTSGAQTVNVSAATLDHLTVSGDTELAQTSATTLTILNSGATLSATVDYSQNTIEAGVSNSTIIAGSGNTIGPNVENVLIAGVDISGTTSDTSYFSNTDVIGGAILSGGTDLYNIFSTSTGSTQLDSTTNMISLANGSIIQSIDITVSSDTTNVDFILDNGLNPGNNMTAQFGGTSYDVAVPDVYTLMPGSDTVPMLNYVFGFLSGGTFVLTGNTSDWPSYEHAPIASVLVQSASGVSTNGAYKVHAWTDHISSTNNQGHLSHINRKLRQSADYISGVDFITTIVDDTPDRVIFSSSSGLVFQLHEHDFPSFSTGSTMLVVNDENSAYTGVTELSDIKTDINGTALQTNNNYWNLVIWGVVSEKSGECRLMINKPDGVYGNVSEAISDTNSTSVYSIPTSFKGTGFLIARITLGYTTPGGGVYTIEKETDLRGLSPSTSVGSSGAGIKETFSDSNFAIFDNVDNSKIAKFDSSEIDSSTTRTYTLPNNSGTILTNASTFPYEFMVAASDETSVLTSGNGKVTFLSPTDMTVTGVTASLTTSGSTQSVIDVNLTGTTIFSTNLTIDANEKNSTTAATPAVITGSTWTQYQEVTVDLDTAGTNATGLKLLFTGTINIT